MLVQTIDLFCLYLPAYLLLNKKKYYWNSFTRIISTLNALQCICLTFYTFYNWKNDILDLKFIANEYQIKSLFWFSAYLFIDGMFQIPDINFDLNNISSILHHLVGSFGIYLIATTRMGFFLGLYFAMTEISTPFLNLSWWFRKKLLFFIFYIFFVVSRIFTFPFPLIYLNNNQKNLLELNSLYYNMSFYGTYSLLFLNFLWFIFISNKIVSKR